MKKKVEQERLREKIDGVMKSTQTLMDQKLEARKELEEKKQQDKMTRWLRTREDEKHTRDCKECKIHLEETKIRNDIIAKKNHMMILDPNAIDILTREWWEMRRSEIVEERRDDDATRAASAVVAVVTATVWWRRSGDVNGSGVA